MSKCGEASISSELAFEVMDSNSEVISPDPQKEYHFPYVIDRICSFLNYSELLNVFEVCTLWREAAVREIKKRKSELLMLPCITTRELNDNNVDFHVFDIVRSKPLLALLFFNTYHRSMMVPNGLQEVIETYKRQLNSQIIAIRVQRSFFKERRNSLLLGCEIIPQGLNVPFGIPSFFLTFYKQTNIKISLCTEEPNLCVPEAANNIYAELMNNISDPWLTMIVFCTKQGRAVVTSFLQSVSKTKKSDSAGIWGCQCTELTSILGDADSIKMPICTVIRIYGSNVKSWTFLITEGRRGEYEQQIAEFKQGIELKSHTIGLITSRASINHPDGTPIIEVLGDDMQDVYDNFECITYFQIFKKAFPTVDFITVSTDGCLFGHNTIDIYYDNDRDHDVIGSAILITYN